MIERASNKKGERHFGIFALTPYKVPKYAKDITSLTGFLSKESAEKFAKEYLVDNDT